MAGPLPQDSGKHHSRRELSERHLFMTIPWGLNSNVVSLEWISDTQSGKWCQRGAWRPLSPSLSRLSTETGSGAGRPPWLNSNVSWSEVGRISHCLSSMFAEVWVKLGFGQLQKLNNKVHFSEKKKTVRPFVAVFAVLACCQFYLLIILPSIIGTCSTIQGETVPISISHWVRGWVNSERVNFYVFCYLNLSQKEKKVD